MLILVELLAKTLIFSDGHFYGKTTVKLLLFLKHLNAFHGYLINTNKVTYKNN